MIEAPEALYLADQINSLLSGKRVILVIVGHTPHKFTFYSGNTSEFEEQLICKSIDNAVSFGGKVEIRLQDTLLIFSDGVNLRYHSPGEKIPAKHQLLIGFDDNSFLTASVRMYGGIWCIPANWKSSHIPYFTGSLHEYYLQAVNKPQVMSADFTKEYFLKLTDTEDVQNKSVKALLATNQTIPGLGNGVLQDILYNARLHPKKKVKEMTPAQKETLFFSITETLKEMYGKQGRNTESDLLGQKGKYIPYLSKDTAGSDCPRCKDIIQKENYLGGSIYYCPGCQEL